jgi:hypothetical protein
MVAANGEASVCLWAAGNGNIASPCVCMMYQDILSSHGHLHYYDYFLLALISCRERLVVSSVPRTWTHSWIVIMCTFLVFD